MTVATRLLERLVDLPPAETRNVGTEPVEIPTPDGRTLRGTHYYPRDLEERPTVLIRSPYPRTGMGLLGRAIAERGFHVLFQNCRGTFGSDGAFEPFRRERADGLATVRWLREREWFTGELATTGPSYLGYAQWAIADAVDELEAMSTQVTSAEFGTVTYPGGALALGLALRWSLSMADPQSTWRFFAREAGVGMDVEAGFRRRPLAEADAAAVGERVPHWRETVRNEDPTGDRWAAIDHSDRVADVTAPNHMVSGWYDFALPQLLRDYRTTVEAGREPYLTIGPWDHEDPQLHGTAIRESIRWFRAHLLGDERGLRDAPVRLYLQGADAWRSFERWPPADATAARLLFQPDGALARERPPDSEPDRYRFDPRSPTPAVGGATFDDDAGQRDQAALEARQDVLTYTSAPLSSPTTAIGPVSADLYVASSRDHADFYVCLCDVRPDGTSLNVCDGIRRVTLPDLPAGPDGSRRVEVDCWPTAYRFGRGHRVRVQVASGAFPRFAPHHGTDEPLATATELRPADQRVYHDPERQSRITVTATDGLELSR